MYPVLFSTLLQFQLRSFPNMAGPFTHKKAKDRGLTAQLKSEATRLRYLLGVFCTPLYSTLKAEHRRQCHHLQRFIPHQHPFASIPTENHILQRLFSPTDIKISVKAIRESIKQTQSLPQDLSCLCYCMSLYPRWHPPAQRESSFYEETQINPC